MVPGTLLNVEFPMGTGVLQGLCRDRGRGERFDWELLSNASIARTLNLAYGCMLNYQMISKTAMLPGLLVFLITLW